MISINERVANIVEVTLSNELSRGDVRQLRPTLKDYGRNSIKPYLFLIAKDFKGWYGSGPWWSDLGLKDDCDCNVSFRRIALAGEGNWKSWMNTFVGSFTSSEIKFFDSGQIEDARLWLNEYTTNKKKRGEVTI